MSLSEAQIQRYSRQIVLREVGGRGQRQLLDCLVLVEGQGAALDVAVAYVAAAGSPIRRAEVEASGFLHGTSLSAFSPDVSSSQPASGWLGTSAPESVELFRVALVQGGVIAAPAGIALPSKPETSAKPEPVTHGAMAALLVQRFALGRESAALCLTWDGTRWKRS